MSWTIFFVFLALVFYLTVKKGFFNMKERQLLFVLLLFKIAGGLTFYSIYVWHYKQGDSLEYYNEAKVLAEVLHKDFNTGLEIYFQKPGECTATSSYWTDQLLSRHYYDADSFFIIKMIGLLVFIGVSSYLVLTLIGVLFSYLLIFYALLLLKQAERNLSVELVILCLIIPTVLVWSNGLGKDNIVYALSLYLMIAGYVKLLGFPINGFNAFIIILSSVFLYSLKPLFLCIILLVFIWAFIFNKLSTRSSPLFNTLLLFPCAILVLSIGAFVGIYFNEKYVFEMIERAYDWNQFSDQGSAFNYGALEYDTLKLVKLSVYSFITALFRPFIWESNTMPTFLQALENLMLLIAGAFVLIKTPIIKLIFSFCNKPAYWFLFMSGVVILIGVGLGTYNFGLLSRFRIVGVSGILFSFLFLLHEQSSKYRTI